MRSLCAVSKEELDGRSAAAAARARAVTRSEFVCAFRADALRSVSGLREASASIRFSGLSKEELDGRRAARARAL